MHVFVCFFDDGFCLSYSRRLLYVCVLVFCAYAYVIKYNISGWIADLSAIGGSSVDAVDPAKTAMTEDTWDDTESESLELPGNKVRTHNRRLLCVCV